MSHRLMVLVKLFILGAPHVGKTSIVRQFTANDFSDVYSPTSVKSAFYPSVMVNERVYEVRIVDIPPLSQFPSDALEEWGSGCRGVGLRSATAYILAFDASDADTFAFVARLRDQITKARDPGVPILVVANKADLLEKSAAVEQRKEIASLVRKQWKCAYVECSAKFNWHVSSVFKEVIRLIDAAAEQSVKQANHSAPGNAANSRRNKRCLLQ